MTYAQNKDAAIQNKQDFEFSKETYIVDYISNAENMERIKNMEKTCEDGHILSQDKLNILAREEARSMFIQEHLKIYQDIYFPQVEGLVTTDTFVCDNGGFEDGFDFYRGYSGRYDHGSDSCVLTRNGQPVTWTEENLPLQNRFEIVNSGIDPVFGINKTKFGNKAARINNKYGHIWPNDCSGHGGVCACYHKKMACTFF